MSEGYIPLSETINYGIFLDDCDLDAFVQIIQALDSFYLEFRAKESEKKKGSS